MLTASGARKRITTWREVARREPMHTCTMTLRRKCFDTVGLLDESLRGGEDDSEFWLRLSYHCLVGHVPEVCAVWRRGGQSSHWSASEQAAWAVRVWESALRWLEGKPVEETAFARRQLARAYWLAAITAGSERAAGAQRYRKVAAAYCRDHKLYFHLVAGLAGWHGPRPALAIRHGRSRLRSLSRPALPVAVAPSSGRKGVNA